MSQHQPPGETGRQALLQDLAALRQGQSIQQDTDMTAHSPWEIPQPQLKEAAQDIVPLAQRMQSSQQWESRINPLPDAFWDEEASQSITQDTTIHTTHLPAIDEPPPTSTTQTIGHLSYRQWLPSLGGLMVVALIVLFNPPHQTHTPITQHAMPQTHNPYSPTRHLPPTLRAKGASPATPELSPSIRMRLFLRRGGHFVKEAPTLHIKAGDQLRFGYWLQHHKRAYLSLFSVDRRRQMTMLYPIQPNQPFVMTSNDKRRMLPGGILLDASSTDTRLYACVSQRPLSPKSIELAITQTAHTHLSQQTKLPLPCLFQKSWYLTESHTP